MKEGAKVAELRDSAAWRRQVGDAVRAARDSRGLTQTDLSLRSGVDYGTISRLEKAKVFPTLPVLVALADALFISIDQLVGHTVAQPERIGDGLAPDQRALLQQRMQAEIDSFLRGLSPRTTRRAIAAGYARSRLNRRLFPNQSLDRKLYPGGEHHVPNSRNAIIAQTEVGNDCH